MPATSTRAACLLLLAALSVGCDGADETAQESDLTSGTELSAKADGITIWLDPVAHPQVRFDQPVWRFDGRASKNLESVFSFASDDEFGEAVQTSARKFQVFVDSNQLEHLLAGHRLLVDVKAATGTVRQYFASIRVAPKLERAHGSSKIVLRKTFSPFFYGKELRFRNLVGVTGGFTTAAASSEPSWAPDGISGSGDSIAMDWLGPVLLQVAQDPTNEIDVTASNGGTAVTRSGSVDIGVTSFQLTTESALDHWPEPQCKVATLTCLQSLPAGLVDRSSCGTAIEVSPCFWKLPASVDESTFSVDLSSYMSNWFGEHGADVAASGGNSLTQSQAFCSASKVTRVTDAADDPQGHDLTKFIVMRHPDIVFPGSDTVWFGAYDIASSTLESIYDFN